MLRFSELESIPEMGRNPAPTARRRPVAPNGSISPVAPDRRSREALNIPCRGTSRATETVALPAPVPHAARQTFYGRGCREMR